MAKHIRVRFCESACILVLWISYFRKRDWLSPLFVDDVHSIERSQVVPVHLGALQALQSKAAFPILVLQHTIGFHYCIR